LKKPYVNVLIMSVLLLFVMGAVLEGAQTGGERAAAGAVNGLAMKLYDRLAVSGENLCFSPYSVSSAFAMAYAGAAGETAAELSGVFGFEEDIHRSNKLLMRNILGAPEDAGELVAANSIWPRRDYKILAPFLKTVKENYEAEIRPQDFKDNAEAARSEINKWIDGKTRGKIQDLIPDGALNSATAMVLANAVYFKAGWLSQFSEDATETAEFYADPDVVSPVSLMKNTEAYEYFENDLIQAVKVPYLRGAYSMTLMLPKERRGIGALEKSLVSGSQDAVMNDMERRLVELYIPRFKIESMFSLNRAIGGLGAPSAFIPSVADFSGINGRRDLFISDAVHGAFISVDEKGTEAAGATAVIARTSSIMLDSAEPVIFRADHPFLFFIKDEMSGAILFMGKVARP
jgi:serpin B